MSLARAIVGSVVGGTIAVMILWFFLPFLYIIYQNFTVNLDTEDQYYANLVNMGNIIFQILPAVVILVTGWNIFAYATERGIDS